MMTSLRDARRCLRAPARLALTGLVLATLAASDAGATAPAIRISATSVVPACVTPERLMAFIASRNDKLEPRFRDIAGHYRRHGEAWRVRWDYAFFQMVVETNYLMFMKGSGKPGDVSAKQNNFAGLGTTGGGVPGDSFPDVSTGVLAQIQHLVVYSGERVDKPVAPRTQLKQDDILLASQPVAARRPITFQDLAGRWASDRIYGRSIEAVAERFRAAYCAGGEATPVAAAPAPREAGTPPQPSQPRLAKAAPAATPTPVQRPASAKPGPAVAKAAREPAAPAPAAGELERAPAEPGRTAGAVFTAARPVPVGSAGGAASRCRVQTASYGGRKALLVRSVNDGEEHFTALLVLDGFERTMAASFLASYPGGGSTLGEFASQQEALARAYELCPTAAGG